jgi:predicted Fe-Mo cluster-binding NifX family protein
MPPMIVCLPVTTDDRIDPRWGRAARLAVADVRDGAIVAWNEYQVGWDVLHDAGTEGGHHARVATFLQAHGVETVVADHMGEPMLRMLHQLGIAVRLGASGEAHRAAVAAARPVA